MEHVLTFDIGTTSVKCCIFDSSLNLRLLHTYEYTLLTPTDHCVELSAAVYECAICECVAQCIAQGYRLDTLQAVSITTQGETMIPVDAEGNALTNAIVWLDGRAQKQAQALADTLQGDVFYQTTGLPELTGATPIAKLMWIHENQPAVYQATHAFLLLEDYLIFRLTGALSSEYSLLSSTGYFDIHNRIYAEEILRAADLEASKLPTPLPCGTVAGHITQQASQRTQLPAGLPVVTTAMDQICAMIGAGNVDEGVVTETTGTCLTVGATVMRPDFHASSRPTIYTHYHDGYAYILYSPTAAIILKWFRDTYLADFTAPEPADQSSVYTHMDAMAASVAPGSDGLLLLPHFAGKFTPSAQPAFRGAFLGLGLHTTRAQCIRAIMEGIGFMLRENIAVLNRLTGMPSVVRSLGGGSRSELWGQIKADILALPLQASPVSESTSAGAAALAWQALGDDGCVARLSQSGNAGRLFFPDAVRTAVYKKQYSQYLRACQLAGAFFQDV